MPLLEINREECISCEVCIDVCPFGALRLDEEDKAVVNELCTACRACLDVCPVEALSLPEVERVRALEGDLYQGVWVWIEQFQGQPCSISWEMLGKGRELADALSTSLTACVLGDGVEGIAKEAIAYGADRVFLMDVPSEGGARLAQQACLRINVQSSAVGSEAGVELRRHRPGQVASPRAGSQQEDLGLVLLG